MDDIRLADDKVLAQDAVIALCRSVGSNGFGGFTFFGWTPRRLPARRR